MDRGQLYTMEAVIGGLLVFIALLFVVQGLGVTPQSSGDANQQAVNQQRALASGTLQSMNESTIRQATLYWDATNRTFHCTPDGLDYYPGHADNATCTKNLTRLPLLANTTGNLTAQVPPNDFGAIMNEQFASGYSYNIYVAYNESNTTERQRMVYQGQPGSGAVRVSRTVMVYNDTELRNATGHPTGRDLSEIKESDVQSFYAPDSDLGSGFWDLLHVEVVVWQG